MRDYFFKNSPIRFRFPVDGDCVNCRDGKMDEDILLLPVVVETETGCEILVNSIRAKEDTQKGCYTAVVPIRGYRNTLLAENKTDGTSCRIVIFRMPENSVGSFRLSSDDNVRFLKELNEKNYASIFEHPYLAVYKKAHDLYGAKVHLNLFYSFDDKARACFSNEHSYFDLSMMTERYKDEFRANADWLKLTFHARSEFPEMPYKNTDSATILKDCIDVYREIIRFAGEECVSDSTTIHWGEVNREGVRALRAIGFRSLTGYFTKDGNNNSIVSYYANEELVDHIKHRDFWVDTEEDMIFGRIDCVLNIGTLEHVKATVEDAASDPHRGGFVSIMIHEQYFYPDYSGYCPDFEERILVPCKYLYEHGYRGAHITEVTEERPLVKFHAFHAL